MQPRRMGSLIGAIFGLIFIVINSGDLPSVAAWVIRGVGVVAFALVMWVSVVRASAQPHEPAPSRRALRTYWACVLFEVLAIPLGAAVINNVIEIPRLTVLWVVLVVGIHFIPFAKAFDAPLFLKLGSVLIALALFGALGVLTVNPVAAPLAAVAAGFVLLYFSFLGARVTPVLQH